MADPLWQPNSYELTHSQMAQFLTFVNKTYHQHFNDYFALQQWSVANKAQFWEAVAQFCNIQFDETATTVFKAGHSMRDATWFEGATLNFAKNLLPRNETQIAIRYACENGYQESWTYAALYTAVFGLSAHLQKLGVCAGDCVAGFMTNCPQTIIAMLATTLLGAVWTSCSPDFGFDGIMDRFGQIKPKVLFAIKSHCYNGKVFQHQPLIEKIQSHIPSIETLIWCEQGEPLPEANHTDLKTESFPFNHPLIILYSSGTTGQPKCMVHGVGGTLIQHLKELRLHCDITENDSLFFYTTCGWMMWNWMASALAIGATLVLYDGAPFTTNKNILFDLIDDCGITHFGAGAKFFESCQHFELDPSRSHSLDTLRCILTTGSPLLPPSFDYIQHHVKNNIRISSISGGSDIISCFALGNPLLPVYRGELQCIGLGMDVHIFDDTGQAVIQQKGELVCTSAFPSMPIYFWNDASGEKYQHAYFDLFPGVWAHGDYAEITSHHGMIIYGRSDATLNPRGVRIGTAEIYRQLEKIPEIVDAVAVGKLVNDSEIIVLCVVLKNGVVLDEALEQRIKKHIRDHTSPLHVPSELIAVPDLPRTVSGKTVELAVKNLINNQPIKNRSALANPEVLELLKAYLCH